MIRTSIRLLLSRSGSRLPLGIAQRTRQIHVLAPWTGVQAHYRRQPYRFMSKKVEVPTMGDSITEGTVSEWVVNEGDSVNADDVVCVLETDKVSIDVRAPCSGKIVKHLAKADDVVGVGAPLFEIEEGEGAPAKAQPESKAEAPAPAKEAKQPEAKGQKEASASTTGKKPSKSPSENAKSGASGLKVAGGEKTERRIPMTRMRARIAERLKEAQNTAASLTTFNEIDMSALMSLRAKHKDLFQEVHGVKLGFMSAFIKASVKALQEQPAVNAYIEEKEIVYHDYCDISVAVATPNGLVVPVLRDCHVMSFADVEHAIVALGKKARDGQLALEDMAGGTFTISNGGVYGSLFGTPILNLPQSAILGMHGIFDRPIAVNGEIKIRPMMYVALTYDHRIIDGREAVTFLKSVKDSIEDPMRLMLEL